MAQEDTNKPHFYQTMAQEDTDNDGVVTWDEYEKNTFGDKDKSKDFDDYAELVRNYICSGRYKRN